MHFPYLQPDHFATDEGRRQLLAEWLTSKNNPYFAKAIRQPRVELLLFARNHRPVDDIRSSNPPINPELLTALTNDFIDHHFDLRYLMRTIVESRTYQLSGRTNEWNADDESNFSHALPRRLTAEELMDALSIATGSRMIFKDVPKDFLAEELPDSKVGMGGFLDLFGRPQRESACECERRSEVSLKQALNLINGPSVGDAVADPEGRIARLILSGAPDQKVIEDCTSRRSTGRLVPKKSGRRRLTLQEGPNSRRESSGFWSGRCSTATRFCSINNSQKYHGQDGRAG